MAGLDLADLRQMPPGQAKSPPAGNLEQGLHLVQRRAQIADFQRIQGATGGEGQVLAIGQAIKTRLGHRHGAGLPAIALVLQADIRLGAAGRGDMDRRRLVAQAPAQDLDPPIDHAGA